MKNTKLIPGQLYKWNFIPDKNGHKGKLFPYNIIPLEKFVNIDADLAIAYNSKTDDFIKENAVLLYVKSTKPTLKHVFYYQMHLIIVHAWIDIEYCECI